MAGPIKLRYSKVADKGLDGIIHFYLTNSGKKSATEFFGKYRKKINQLETMPRMGSPLILRSQPEKSGLRYLLIGKSCRIVYSYSQVEKLLMIHVVVHPRISESTLVGLLEEE
ncbi:type II toxin-antitoxin system RelE/ParE family toxin [Neolewinella antarctica]|uniref:Plasmid stabilization system protein ParE n=1 Tax=Neolewinella antarctica TaxID=442734 RepID=A0ABX0XDU4_9BACT|nr:plasmid stabilization system protein ParE [Neolewinella antarctica]